MNCVLPFSFHNETLHRVVIFMALFFSPISTRKAIFCSITSHTEMGYEVMLSICKCDSDLCGKLAIFIVGISLFQTFICDNLHLSSHILSLHRDTFRYGLEKQCAQMHLWQIATAKLL